MVDLPDPDEVFHLNDDPDVTCTSDYFRVYFESVSGLLSGIANGGAKLLVRVGGYDDRPGIQQALDLDSLSSEAQYYVAMAYDQLANPQAATRQYRRRSG